MARARKEAQKSIKKACRRYRAALEEVGDAYFKLWELHDLGASNDESVAAAEANFLSTTFGDDYQPLGDTVSHLVAARLLVATDHVRATGVLLVESKTGVFSVWATGRGLLESCGLTYWLLDPNVDPVTRLVRVMNDRLASLSGACRLIERGRIPEDMYEKAPAVRMDEVVAQAEALGFDVNGTGTTRRLRGDVVPSYTNLVDDLTLPGIYSLFSGYAHNEIWAIGHQQEEARELVDPSGQGRAFSKVRVTLPEYQALCILLAEAYEKSVERVIGYYGWTEVSQWEETMARSKQKLSKLL